MKTESNHASDKLDLSEESFKNKEKGNDDDTFSPPEESEPPHEEFSTTFI